MKSLLVWIFSALMIIYATCIYAPSWSNGGEGHTIGWDITGYYAYLPAVFIYKDLHYNKFIDSINNKYHYDNIGRFFHPVKYGTINTYSSGMAVFYSPAFFIAHWLAGVLGYDQDGFSLPYQMAISLWSVLIAIFGLFLLRKLLLYYFNDTIVAITMFCIFWGTNYLEYTTISGAYTHNYLFTFCCLLLLATRAFYQNPNYRNALYIGCILGLMALARPTEIAMSIIPLFWGVSNWSDLKFRLNSFIPNNIKKYALAIFCCLAIGSVQLIYWKVMCGSFIFYSYVDQHLDLLHPTFMLSFFSFHRGWLTWSPMIIIILIGFYTLWKFHRSFAIWTTILLLAYVWLTFSWSCWDYGGAVGQRGMVEIYPALALVLGFFIQNILASSITKRIITASFMLLFVQHNLWITHGCHNGGYIDVTMMNDAFFLQNLWNWAPNPDRYMLYDNSETKYSTIKDSVLLHFNDFEKGESTDSTASIGGKYAILVDKDHKSRILADVYVGDQKFKYPYLRTSVLTKMKLRNYGQHITQLAIVLFKGEKNIKERSIGLDRLAHEAFINRNYVDIKIPKDSFDRVKIMAFNYSDNSSFLIDDVNLINW
jgi:hypothetical protein